MAAAASSPSFLSGWPDRVRALRNIPPVLRILWDSGPGLTAAAVGLRVLIALNPVAMLWVGKLILDAVNAARGQAVVPAPLWGLVAVEFGLAALGHIVGRIIGYCDGLLADRFTKHISLRIMRHAASLDLVSFEDPVFYDKLERARVQATDRIGMLVAIGGLIQQMVTLVSLGAGVFLFSPWLLLLLVACVVPAFLGETHFAFLGYTLNYRLTPQRRELDYLRVLGTSRESVKEMKIFGLGPHLEQRFASLSDRVIGDLRKLANRRLAVGGALALLGALGYYAAYALVVYRTVTGSLQLGDLVFLAGAISGTSGQLASLFATTSSIADQALFLTDLMEFFAVQPRIASKDHALPAPRPIRDGFRLENVSFRYPGAARLILDRLDLRLEPGEKLALVGENGQGKTTLVKLLVRLYDPTAGRILLDGVDLREYSLDDLHREVGVIFQDFVRYEMTASENIGVGRIDRQDDRDLIAEAARKSLAADVVRKLEGGYGQLLGRRFEGGVDLSGGEWQKFALARAYLRDAQLLVLDEPTAALDAMAEYEVFQRFADLTRGKMAVLISHRFSTVRMADRIVVLEGGAIREQGSHDQLLRHGGRYAAMFQLQAEGYR